MWLDFLKRRAGASRKHAPKRVLDSTALDAGLSNTELGGFCQGPPPPRSQRLNGPHQNPLPSSPYIDATPSLSSAYPPRDALSTGLGRGLFEPNQNQAFSSSPPPRKLEKNGLAPTTHYSPQPTKTKYGRNVEVKQVWCDITKTKYGCNKCWGYLHRFGCDVTHLDRGGVVPQDVVVVLARQQAQILVLGPVHLTSDRWTKASRSCSEWLIDRQTGSSTGPDRQTFIF